MAVRAAAVTECAR